LDDRARVVAADAERGGLRRVEERGDVEPDLACGDHDPRSYDAMLARPVRIATWNVNSIRARLERLTGWLSGARPRVVLWQETKCPDERPPREPIEELGYQIAHHGQKGYNSVAILAKSRIEDVRTGVDDERFDAEARVIQAQVGEWIVVSVYAI